jgi:DNA-binding LacI/PurR family transcriptional regulator
VTKRPTIADVARAAGVSIAVVSYTLNGRPGVSDSTRERVLRVAEEYGWRPSAAARSLRSTPRTVGLVLPAGGGSLGGEDRLLRFVTALQIVLRDRGVGVLLHVADDHDSAVRVCREWWAERQVYAVIVPDVRRTDARLARLAETGVPAVGLDGPPDLLSMLGTPAIWADESAAFGRLAGYLTSLGHRRLARVTAGTDLAADPARAAALATVAARAGSTVATVPVPDRAGAAAATRRLLQDGADRPTAIVYDDDAAAMAALDVARRLGVDVPWELSVVSAVDSARCGLVTPSVTALSRDGEAYGHAAGELLLGILDGRPATSHQVPTPVLRLRGSTGPAAR